MATEAPDPEVVPTGTVTAAYEVYGGTAEDFELTAEGMSPAQVAEWLDGRPVDVNLCHQCAHEISDPQVGELAGFSVGGRHYSYDPELGRWAEYRDRLPELTFEVPAPARPEVRGDGR